VRQSISSVAVLPEAVVEAAIARLRADLDSGAWQRRHGHLSERGAVDLGYRIVVAGAA
jgi:hypothetical protein